MAINLTIDGKLVSVPPGTVVADAAKKVGISIPVFCYHPKLEPVGMCRMCLVEVGTPQIDRNTRQPVLDADGKPVVSWMPKLQTACTTPVSEGMVVRTETQVVKEAQRAVLEFLLTSHPLDCPVCDKGGECPLQNLTLGFGPGQTRFEYSEKQHLAKQVPLGDLIYLDRERCIQCSRCIRFQDELADDHVLGFFNRGRTMEITTFSDPPFDSYFSGNTTDICPVGALTTKDFHFRARPWELENVPSVCNHCAVGCNLTLGTRRSAQGGGGWEILRVMTRQNEQVNEIWICDKGRFGHHHVKSAERLSRPLVRDANGKLAPASWDDALSMVAGHLKAADERVAGIVGDRLTNEDYYLFSRLFREGLKSYNMQVRPHVAGYELAKEYGVASGTNFGSMGKGSAIVVIAGDVEQEAPVWLLRIRGALERGAALVVANGRATKLDRYTQGLHYHYGAETQVVLGLLHVIFSENLVKPEVAAKIDGLNELEVQVASYTSERTSILTGVPQQDLVNAARAIANATDAVFVIGSEGVAEGEALTLAVANLAIVTGHVARPNNGLLRLLPHNNSQGAADLISNLQSPISSAKALYVVGTDPVGDGEVLPKDAFIVVQELFLTETAKQANVVLPALAFAERDGTYTNAERRVQRFYAALPATAGKVDARADWDIITDVGRRLGMSWRYFTAEVVMEELAQSVPVYAGMTYARLAQTQEQWPPMGAEDLYFGGTAYDNRGGLGKQYPAECEKMPRFAVKWGEPPALPATRGDIVAVPVRRLYHRGMLIAQSHLLDSRTLLPYIALARTDADRLGIADGDSVTVTLPSGEREMTARVDGEAPHGAALVPAHITTNITLTNVSKK
jgi:NADH-quinone oxidoreductase subunit G